MCSHAALPVAPPQLPDRSAWRRRTHALAAPSRRKARSSTSRSCSSASSSRDSARGTNSRICPSATARSVDATLALADSGTRSCQLRARWWLRCASADICTFLLSRCCSPYNLFSRPAACPSPFRPSKLKRIVLIDLGGNARTSVICTVSQRPATRSRSCRLCAPARALSRCRTTRRSTRSAPSPR